MTAPHPRDAQPSFVALVPARAGSARVPGKNTRLLAGHPLLAYAIATARASGLFDRVIVSTDSPQTAEIARHYGAEVPFLRPAEFATATSPDIEWITDLLNRLLERYDAFAILRPTSPFRGPDTVSRAWRRFGALSASHGIDSLRAIELCHEHPGKMWTLDGERMHPLLDQSHLDVAWHAGQYAALPKVYVQNSSLEIAWSRVVSEHRSREGRMIAPFFTEGAEGFSIDYEEDWERAERMVADRKAALPPVDVAPFEKASVA